MASAQTQATSGSDCWAQTFSYDRYANLLNVGAPAGYSGCTAPQPNFAVDGGNHIINSGFTYDAAGNLTNDGSQPYIYDAENHVMSANGHAYEYDGDGMRVAKTSDNEIDWFDEGGNLIAETSSSGGDTRQYMWFNGRMIARFEISTGKPFFYFADALRSTRAVTDANGNVQTNIAYFPFGQEKSITSSVFYKFTNKKRDPETQNDSAHLRMYEPQLARWLSVDPVPSSASAEDPQSLNRYSYVQNNTLNAVDPTGGFRWALNCSLGESGLWCSWGPASNFPFFRFPIGPIGNPGGNPRAAKFRRCCQQAFGNTSGVVPGTNGWRIDDVAAVYLMTASQLTGEDVSTLAATYLIESGGGNLYPINPKRNANGTQDIGPMQLNYGGTHTWPAGALGPNLLSGQRFAGSPFVNILAGAGFLKDLPDPGDYYSRTPSLRKQRDNALGRLTPRLKPLFDCLQKP